MRGKSDPSRGSSPANLIWSLTHLVQCEPMSQAGYGFKHRSRHGCLLIAKTGQQGPVQYKGDTGVNLAARPPEGGPAEPRDLSTRSLPLLDNTLWDQSQQQTHVSWRLINGFIPFPKVLAFFHTLESPFLWRSYFSTKDTIIIFLTLSTERIVY